MSSDVQREDAASRSVGGQRPIGRPRTYTAPRSSTGVRFPTEMLAALHEAADERGLSVNYLVVKACEEFLEHLIPVAELRLTRPRGGSET